MIILARNSMNNLMHFEVWNAEDQVIDSNVILETQFNSFQNLQLFHECYDLQNKILENLVKFSKSK